MGRVASGAGAMGVCRAMYMKGKKKGIGERMSGQEDKLGDNNARGGPFSAPPSRMRWTHPTATLPEDGG
jgi:hypothetical protein